ncbi:hypothetical protein; putative exported protein [Xenorhabdus nematophila ATCC 19061]|uniref:Uncharacterized protein n=1 Tax=Xenorhabdus nematophila (strain ATCC 19061 / DSM 3370 / CCUG 14189 / LMG 1036 / NCIMB 9965 / AN6) TaxID=406817 RepID=D3VGQ5_XENNA|nr:hypothetical protein [Xenorhabdus nematophila]CBJ90491.1 hypothetical protein; putative exported protein [Xenorhabdus nematophila ATCC 19061]CEE90022.1 hypothetical protein; putative exported protein [Xenorhabdus nematophila str. Anatoliense]CEE92106.1 hypothetical protein; putative exported protein [Xenorhabdus nematophila str. Anatoliense]CEK23334.1 hypothetical protein; putative exported protein [Xenorhabdus nematophila AN6/1]
MKKRLYVFYILFSFISNSYAVELMKDEISSNGNYNIGKNNVKAGNLAQYYDFAFENTHKHDSLKIEVLDSQCMYNVGDKNISLKPKEEHEETLEDNNNFFDDCTGEDKFVEWKATSYRNGKQYQSCNFSIYTTYPPWISGYIDWTTQVNTFEGCSLELSATCNGSDCLNNPVYSSTSDDHNKVTVTLKSNDDWDDPKITSPKPNSTVENNYITFTGTGFMKDGYLPVITTNFNAYKYATQSTGSAEDWKGQLWIGCGITGAIRIDGVENSDVTFNGPPCGATITSIQDGQIIPAGKYSLSGIVNSDTADDDRRMQVQITGYQKDGTIYAPTMSYTPDVDTGTGKWNLEGLEAVCFIHYKASVSSHFELQSTNQSLLPEISGKKEVSYSTSPCPIELTNPKNHEVVSSTTVNEQNIFIGGKATDGTIIVNVKSADFQGNFEQSFSGNVVDNKWSVEAENVPIGIMKIQAKNSESTEFPSQNDNAEVTILSSKIFSVEVNNINVFTKFSGTSMPEVEDEDLMPEVNILLYENQLEEAFTNEYGDWVTKNKYYAKRGEYNFTFQEESNSETYKSRDKKILKCTGSDRGMICVK